MLHIALQEIRVVTRKTENHLHFLIKFLCQLQPSTSEPDPKVQERQKLFNLGHDCVDNLMVDTVNQKIIYMLIS